MPKIYQRRTYTKQSVSDSKPDINNIAEIKANEVKSDAEQIHESEAEEPKDSKIEQNDQSMENDYHEYLKSNRKSVKPIELRDGYLLFELDDIFENYKQYCDSINEAPLNQKNSTRMILKSKAITRPQVWFDGKRRIVFKIRRDWFAD